jgi:hypothetical protein
MKDKMAFPKELTIHSTWKGGKGSGHEKYLIWHGPKIPPGKKGWRASGKLDLDLIRWMASLCP